MGRIARVLVDGVSDLVLDYVVPEDMQEVRPGARVQIPLRNMQSTATVLTVFDDEGGGDYQMKPIHRLIDPEPLISEPMMELARWAADYYAVPLEQMIRCLLPETVRQDQGTPKTRKMLYLEKKPNQEDIEVLFTRAPRQASILQSLLTTPSGSLPLQDLGGSLALEPARSLVRKGWVRIEEETVHRQPMVDEEFVESKPMRLNECQQKALEGILVNIESPERKPILLQGVTGSGKTEVYLQATERVVKQGKSVLILVPEISLTPQTLQRFKSRFASLPGSVAVLHSMLSDGERFDEWHAIRQGKARIVVGPRSAVFAPVRNLGLIIVDEEHDGSYKQENSPRYHGRDLAVLRAKFEHASVILGSATPSMESVRNVLVGKYERLRLDERADGKRLPLIRVLDMRLEGSRRARQGGGVPFLSERLRMAVNERLERDEQVIFLLNRRGFACSLQCPDCGAVVTCPHCARPLTYHKTEERLICHLCAYQAVTPRVCPECHSHNILFQGYGTEKVEELMKKVFTQACLARIDADIARRKNAVRDILRQFRAHKIDILLGTQMIAKGLDFPNVTLVGVLNADISLHIPDLRASERTFQLMTQVAGRAGRGDIDGEVIIQTFTPQAPAIQYARHHDSDGFAEQELELRQAFDLPPYSHMALLTIRAVHDELASFAAQSIYRRLLTELPESVTMTEPLPAPIPKAYGQYRYQITFKAPQARTISRHVRKILSQLSLGREVTAVLDIDVYSFM